MKLGPPLNSLLERVLEYTVNSGAKYWAAVLVYITSIYLATFGYTENPTYNGKDRSSTHGVRSATNAVGPVIHLILHTLQRALPLLLLASFVPAAYALPAGNSSSETFEHLDGSYPADIIAHWVEQYGPTIFYPSLLAGGIWATIVYLGLSKSFWIKAGAHVASAFLAGFVYVTFRFAGEAKSAQDIVLSFWFLACIPAPAKYSCGLGNPLNYHTILGAMMLLALLLLFAILAWSGDPWSVEQLATQIYTWGPLIFPGLILFAFVIHASNADQIPPSNGTETRKEGRTCWPLWQRSGTRGNRNNTAHDAGHELANVNAARSGAEVPPPHPPHRRNSVSNEDHRNDPDRAADDTVAADDFSVGSDPGSDGPAAQ